MHAASLLSALNQEESLENFEEQIQFSETYKLKFNSERHYLISAWL